MRETNKQFAHRCLPLLIANQSGWLLLNRDAFRATWDGGAKPSALTIDYPGAAPDAPLAASHFGYGILTWHVGYLFRTPPGYNLAVSGPTNMPKDGICALQGVVETDWAVATFTMNWKFTRPRHAITFDAGEPFCMIAVQRRHEQEEVIPRMVQLEQEPELAAQWREFDRRRQLMLGLRGLVAQRAKALDAAAPKLPYERHYFEGTSPGGMSAPEHQQKLNLRHFTLPENTDDSDRG